MKRTIFISGILGGILVVLLRWSQYQFLVVDHSVEIYAALIAATFAALGIWLGIRLNRRPLSAAAPVTVANADTANAGSSVSPFTPDGTQRDALGITSRELEVLALVAEGMSNREIAGELFVSENTVKTHCSRAFDKLGARRRTEAVQLGKKFGLIP